MDLLGNDPHVIHCKLDGPLVSDEGITRKSITLYVDYKNEKLVGCFNSSGAKFGGKEEMVMSGTNLVLEKPEGLKVRPLLQ